MRQLLHCSRLLNDAWAPYYVLQAPICILLALVAQWIEHQTSNLGVAGSSPARGIRFGPLPLTDVRVV